MQLNLQGEIAPARTGAVPGVSNFYKKENKIDFLRIAHAKFFGNCSFNRGKITFLAGRNSLKNSFSSYTIQFYYSVNLTKECKKLHSWLPKPSPTKNLLLSTQREISCGIRICEATAREREDFLKDLGLLS